MPRRVCVCVMLVYFMVKIRCRVLTSAVPRAPGCLRDANCFCYLCQVPTVLWHSTDRSESLSYFCVCLRNEMMHLAICVKKTCLSLGPACFGVSCGCHCAATVQCRKQLLDTHSHSFPEVSAEGKSCTVQKKALAFFSVKQNNSRGSCFDFLTHTRAHSVNKGINSEENGKNKLQS